MFFFNYNSTAGSEVEIYRFGACNAFEGSKNKLIAALYAYIGEKKNLRPWRVNTWINSWIDNTI